MATFNSPNDPTHMETVAFVYHLFKDVNDARGVPYYLHCIRVEMGLPAYATPDERKAALLHDVIEDTDTTYYDLLNRGYSLRVADLVWALTFNDPDRTYMDQIMDIRNSDDLGLINIKLSDNKDNSDPARHTCFTLEKSERMMKKYKKARKILMEAYDTLQEKNHEHSL